jgi:hypothetical protein
VKELTMLAKTPKATTATLRSTRDRFVDAGFHVSVALLGVAMVVVVALTAF